MNYDLFATQGAAAKFDGGAEVVARRIELPFVSPVLASTQSPGEEISLEEVRPEQVHEAIEVGNRVMVETNVRLKYSVDELTDDLVVTVVERSTGQVIRQIPPEAIVKMRQRLVEMVGLLLDESA